MSRAYEQDVDYVGDTPAKLRAQRSQNSVGALPARPGIVVLERTPPLPLRAPSPGRSSPDADLAQASSFAEQLGRAHRSEEAARVLESKLRARDMKACLASGGQLARAGHFEAVSDILKLAPVGRRLEPVQAASSAAVERTRIALWEEAEALRATDERVLEERRESSTAASSALLSLVRHAGVAAEASAKVAASTAREHEARAARAEAAQRMWSMPQATGGVLDSIRARLAPLPLMTPATQVGDPTMMLSPKGAGPAGCSVGAGRGGHTPPSPTLPGGRASPLRGPSLRGIPSPLTIDASHGSPPPLMSLSHPFSSSSSSLLSTSPPRLDAGRGGSPDKPPLPLPTKVDDPGRASPPAAASTWQSTSMLQAYLAGSRGSGVPARRASNFPLYHPHVVVQPTRHAAVPSTSTAGPRQPSVVEGYGQGQASAGEQEGGGGDGSDAPFRLSQPVEWGALFGSTLSTALRDARVSTGGTGGGATHQAATVWTPAAPALPGEGGAAGQAHVQDESSGKGRPVQHAPLGGTGGLPSSVLDASTGQQLDRIVRSARRRAFESVHSKIIVQAAKVLAEDTAATRQLARVAALRCRVEATMLASSAAYSRGGSSTAAGSGFSMVAQRSRGSTRHSGAPSRPGTTLLEPKQAEDSPPPSDGASSEHRTRPPRGHSVSAVSSQHRARGTTGVSSPGVGRGPALSHGSRATTD